MLYYPPLTFRSLEQSEMRTLFLAIILLLASTCAVRAGDGDEVIWWMFDEAEEIHEVNGLGTKYIDTLEGRGDAAGKRVNAIRIGAYDGDALLGYLLIGDDRGDIGTSYIVPTSSLDGDEDCWSAGPGYARVGEYADASVTFMIELGFLNGDDNTWLILAASDAATYNELYEAGFITATMDIQGSTEWTGGTYSVPEPSSGLLILIGGALLALRRRRRAA